MRTSASYNEENRNLTILVDDRSATLFGAKIYVTRDGIEGWFGGGSGVRRQEEERMGRHGNHRTPGKRAARVVTISGVAWGESRAHTAQLVDEWNAVLADGEEGTLTIVDPDQGSRWAHAYLNDTPEVDWIGDDTFTWSLDVICPDPRKYGTDVDEQITGPPVALGGLVFDLFASAAAPGILDFGPASVEGKVTVQNVGTAESAVEFTVYGPTTESGFTITEVALDGEGRRIESRLELAPGSWLDIDTANGLVTLDGTSDRTTALLVAQFGRGLGRGEQRTYLFTAANPDARLKVRVIPAWW